MAVVADVNFGGDFNADEFRTQIRNAMIMGLPNDVSEQPTLDGKFKENIQLKIMVETHTISLRLQLKF